MRGRHFCRGFVKKTLDRSTCSFNIWRIKQLYITVSSVDHRYPLMRSTSHKIIINHAIRFLNDLLPSQQQRHGKFTFKYCTNGLCPATFKLGQGYRRKVPCCCQRALKGFAAFKRFTDKKATFFSSTSRRSAVVISREEK